jgi:hypothetical protein
MATAPTAALPTTGRRAQLKSAFADNPSLAPMLLAVAIFIWFSADEGGFKGTTFLAGEVLVLGLLVVSLAALPRPHPSRKVLAAI